MICWTCRKDRPRSDFYASVLLRAGRGRRSIYCKSCQARFSKAGREFYRRKALEKYGGKCQCCGEQTEEFLTFDHIGGRRSGAGKNAETSLALYYRLYYEGNDPNIRILCYNCNCSLGSRGYCPHQAELLGPAIAAKVQQK